MISKNFDTFLPQKIFNGVFFGGKSFNLIDKSTLRAIFRNPEERGNRRNVSGNSYVFLIDFVEKIP